jgi:AraC-like DNA-binding protein
MTFSQLMNVAIISCLTFIAVFTISKKSNTPLGFRFLSAFFILLSSVFADELLKPFYVQYPLMKIIIQPLLFTIAPTVYLSILHLTSIRRTFSFKQLLHFIPYLLVLSIYFMSYLRIGEQKKNIMVNDTISVGDLLLFVFYIQAAVYLYQSIKQLNQHKKNLVLFVANLHPNDYHWLSNTLISLVITAIVAFLDFLFYNNSATPHSFYIIYLIIFYYLGIQISKQKDVFNFTEGEKESLIAIINDTQLFDEKEEKLPLSESQNRKKVIPEYKLEEYKIQLLDLMKTEKPYLDSEMTLPKLGQLLNLNTYQTSYLINYCFKENFYTFINRYRIETFKTLLTDKKHQHFSLLGLAFESGFNSKTTFNTVFKKQMGLSPKAFKEKTSVSTL